jgi:hypothetical protein
MSVEGISEMLNLPGMSGVSETSPSVPSRFRLRPSVPTLVVSALGGLGLSVSVIFRGRLVWGADGAKGR